MLRHPDLDSAVVCERAARMTNSTFSGRPLRDTWVTTPSVPFGTLSESMPTPMLRVATTQSPFSHSWRLSPESARHEAIGQFLCSLRGSRAGPKLDEAPVPVQSDERRFQAAVVS